MSSPRPKLRATHGGANAARNVELRPQPARKKIIWSVTPNPLFTEQQTARRADVDPTYFTFVNFPYVRKYFLLGVLEPKKRKTCRRFLLHARDLTEEKARVGSHGVYFQRERTDCRFIRIHSICCKRYDPEGTVPGAAGGEEEEDRNGLYSSIFTAYSRF